MDKNIIEYVGYFGFALLMVSAAVGMWYDKPTDINNEPWGRKELTREEKITEKALLFFYVGALLVAICGILVLLMHRG